MAIFSMSRIYKTHAVLRFLQKVDMGSIFSTMQALEAVQSTLQSQLEQCRRLQLCLDKAKPDHMLVCPCIAAACCLLTSVD